MNQFAHDSTDSEHFVFSASDESIAKRFERLCGADGSEGRKIKSLAKTGIAKFGKLGFLLDRMARLMMARNKTGMSSQLAGGGEGVKIRDLSEDDDGGVWADAGNGVQQFALAFELRKLIEMLADEGFDVSGLLIQMGNGFGDQVTNGSRTTTSFQAIEFLGAKILELFKPAGESLKLIEFDRRWHPGGRVLGVTKMGNDDGIKFVGFTTFELCLSEPLDLQWVDDTDPVTCGEKELGDWGAITAGGFQTGMNVGNP